MKTKFSLRFCFLLMPALLSAQGLDPTTIGRPLGTSDDWPVYGGDNDHTHFTRLQQITPANVSRLQKAWTFHLKPANLPADARLRMSQDIPLVVGNVMYIVSPYSQAIALNGPHFSARRMMHQYVELAYGGWQRLGAHVIEGAAIVALPELGGSRRLREAGLPLFTLVDFSGH